MHFSFLFISECKFNGILIKPGDDVIINGDNDKSFVGHVEKLYELKGTHDPNRAIISWYFTYEELKKCSKKITFDVAEPWRELFLPCHEDASRACSIADIDAETISSKCTVLKLKPQDLPPKSLNCDRQEDLFYVHYKFDRNYNLHPVNKRIARESVSKREQDLLTSVSNGKTPNGTARKSSTGKQKPVNENTVKSTGKTPQARKTPARRKSKPLSCFKGSGHGAAQII